MTLDPALWDDLLKHDVDGQAVELVRVADTSSSCWAAYDNGSRLGTVVARLHGEEPVWQTQETRETFDSLADAVRALRRPASWPQERIEVSCWAQELLADDSLTVVDVETTGLGEAWAVQIAAIDRDGSVLFSEHVNPRAEIEPGAIALHGITPQRVAESLEFGQLLQDLTMALQGRTIVSFNAEYEVNVFERELIRHFGRATSAREWLAGCRWHDALVPYAVWQGLWSARRGDYRLQRLDGPHDAVADCRLLLWKLQLMARTVPSYH